MVACVARERFGRVLNDGCCLWWQRIGSGVCLGVSTVCAIAHGVLMVYVDTKIDFGYRLLFRVFLLTYEFTDQQTTYFKRQGHRAKDDDASSLTDRCHKPPGEHSGERTHLADEQNTAQVAISDRLLQQQGNERRLSLPTRTRFFSVGFFFLSFPFFCAQLVRLRLRLLACLLCIINVV